MIAVDVQAAVVRADLILCRICAWPWKQMGLSVVIAAAVIYAVKAVMTDGGVGN